MAHQPRPDRDRPALGFLARHFVEASLPLRQPETLAVRRRNGHTSYWMTGHPDLGLPYGRYPRLLLVWLTSEAVRTKSPTLHLGASLSHFMRELGLLVTGGRWGTIPRLRDQMRRLFGATAGSTSDQSELGEWTDQGFRVASRAHLWWRPAERASLVRPGSIVELSPDFFGEVIRSPVPIDLRTLGALRAPLAIDLYAWLTYRMSYLQRPTLVAWHDLAEQFGSNYQRPRDLRAQVRKHTLQIQAHYPTARLELNRDGLLLRPGKSHL